jgi:hypothetical protein
MGMRVLEGICIVCVGEYVFGGCPVVPGRALRFNLFSPLGEKRIFTSIANLP